MPRTDPSKRDYRTGPLPWVLPKDTFEQTRRRTPLLIARRINHLQLILLAMEDVTDHKEKEALRAAKAVAEEMIQQLMDIILKQRRCQVKMVTNGLQAVETFRPGKFDLVFLDMHMPEMGGLEATQDIRRMEREAGKQPVQIIALTADVQRETQQQCKEAGMDSFLSKPLEIDPLYAILQQQR